MPYDVKRDTSLCSEGEPWCVVNASTGDLKGCHSSRTEAEAQMRALYANEPMMKRFGVTVSEDQRFDRAPIEWRAAQMADVDYNERVITVIAVPYEQRTKIPFNGEMWDEMFLYGAFNELGIQARQRFSVNRDHDKLRTVGRVMRYDTTRPEGLIIEARISPTPLGEETLILARDEALFGSVGFMARRTDQILDRNTMTRSIKRAFLDHLAFVPDPAYEGAEVLSVRGADQEYRLTPTPAIDDFLSDPLMRWSQQRREKRD